MNTKVSVPARSGNHGTHSERSDGKSFKTYKDSYQAKLETLRRKEVRKHKRRAGSN